MQFSTLYRPLTRALVLVGFLSIPGACATKYWVSVATGNWSNTNNWSTTPGGAGGAGVPTSVDNVVFEGTRKGSCTINVNVTVSSMTLSTSTLGGFTNNIIQLSTISVTTIGEFLMNNGTYTALTSSMTISSNVVINGGRFNLFGSSMTVRGNWTSANASFFVGTSTITFSTSTVNHTINTNGKPFNNIQFQNVGSWVLSSTMTVLSTVTIRSGTLDTSASNCSGGSCAMSVRGSWYNLGGTFTANTSTLTFNGTTPQKIITSADNFYNLQINGSAGTWVLQDTMTVTSTMTLTAGTLDTSATNCSGTACSISVGGGWLNTAGTFNAQGATVTFSGATVGQTIRSRGSPFKNVSMAGAGYWTLLDSMTVTSTMTLTVGTLDTSTSNLGILLGGNWTNTGGTFQANNSTITFNGAAAQRFQDLSETSYNVLIDSNTSAGGLTLASSFTATAFRVDTTGLAAAASLFFLEDSTFTINTLLLRGVSGKAITIRSTTDGSQWMLNNTGSSSATVVNVRDSNARAGKLITADDLTNTDSGNNLNWDFGASGLLRTWWGTTDNVWSKGSNWDTGVPAAQDSALIVSTATNMPVLSGAVVVSSLTINDGASMSLSGYGVTLSSFTNAGTLVLRGTEPVTSVPNNLDGSTVSFVSVGTSIVLTTWTYSNLWINGANGTFTLPGSPLIITSTLTLTAGTLNTNATGNNAISLNGSWVNTGGAFTCNGSTVTLTATTPQTLRTRGFLFRNLTIGDGPGGYFTLVDSMTLSASTIRPGNTLDLAGSGVRISSFTNAGLLRLQSLEPVTGAPLGIAGSTIAYTATSGSPIIRSTWTYRNLEIDDGGASIIFNSSGTITVNENLILTAGTLDVTASNNQLSVANDWTNISGNFVARSSTVTFTGTTAGHTITSNGSPFNHLRLNGSGGYWTMVDSMTVTSTMTFTVGTLDTSISNLPIRVGGGWVNTGGDFVDNNSTVTFSGTSVGQRIQTRGFPFAHVEVNGTNGYWTMIDSMTVTSTMTLTAGTLDTSTSHLGLLLGGNWTNNGGSFVSNSSTITFNGTTGQRFRELSDTSYNVIIDSNTSSGGVIFASSFTVNGLWVNGAGLGDGTTLYFNAGSTFTVGSLYLVGGSGQQVWIRSTTDGMRWSLNNTGPNLVDYVNVKDSDARLGALILANDGTSFDATGNLNWNFGALGALRTWWGTTDSLWTKGTNWDTSVPGPQDSVLIVSTATTMPILTTPITISSLTINSGALMTLSGNSVTLSSFTNAGSLVLVGTETITTAPDNQTGSTVTYNSSGASIILSTWSYSNLQISGTNGVFTLTGSPLVVDSTLTLTAGQLNTSATGNNAINLAGSWINTGAVFTSNGSTVTMLAATPQTIRTRGHPFRNLTLGDGTEGYWTLIDSVTVSAMTVRPGGTLDLAGFGVRISSFTNAGSLRLQSLEPVTGAPLGISGSTITFTATTGVPLIFSTWTYRNLVINGASATTFSSTGPITVNEDLTLASGTLDMTATNHPLSVNNNWTNTAGAFTARASTVTFTGTSTGNTIASRGYPFSSVRFNGSGGYWTMVDSMTITSTMTMTVGTLDTSASNLDIRVGGGWVNTGGDFVVNASTVTFSGTAVGQRIQTRGFPFWNIQVNGTNGYWTMIDSMTVTSTMTITAGTLDSSTSNNSLLLGGGWFNTGGTFTTNGSTLTFSAATPQSIRSRGSPFRNVTFGGVDNGYWTLIDSMTVSATTIRPSNTLNLNGVGIRVSSFTNAGALRLQSVEPVTGAPLGIAGSTITYTATAGTPLVFSTWTYRTLELEGGGAVIFSSTGPLVVNEDLLLTAGTLDMTTSNNSLSVTRNWINTGGGFVPRSSTATFNGTTTGNTITSRGFPFGNLQLNGSGGYWTMVDSMTLTSTMTLTAGTLDTSPTDLPMTVRGGWINTGGVFEVNSSTVIFTATTPGQRMASRGFPFANIQFNGTGGYWTMQDSMTVISTITLTAGSLDSSSTGHYGILLRGDWLDNGGTFVGNRSTVTLSGTTAQTVNASGQTFEVLLDSNTSSGGVTWASGFTANYLRVNSVALNSGTTMYFDAGSTFTITNLNLQGGNGKNVWIRPTPANQLWYLNNVTTNTVSFTDVAYSSASAGMTIVAGSSSTDSGNNTNWTFTILSVSLTPSTYDFGSVNIGGSTVSVSAVTTVSNNGNGSESYSISVATTGALTRWGVGTTVASTDTFILQGLFNSVQPTSAAFSNTHIVISTPTAATGAIYAGDQTGVTVPVGATRPLWMKLLMPTATNSQDQQSMLVTISATSP